MGREAAVKSIKKMYIVPCFFTSKTDLMYIISLPATQLKKFSVKISSVGIIWA